MYLLFGPHESIQSLSEAFFSHDLSAQDLKTNSVHQGIDNTAFNHASHQYKGTLMHKMGFRNNKPH